MAIRQIRDAHVIIFGLAVFFFRTLSEGTFHCPNCGGDRRYRHKEGRRWFTLFFVPVIPLTKVGEVVVCETCRTKYNVEVLGLPTAGQMEQAHPAAMRAAASVVLRAGDPTDPNARARAVSAVRGAGLRSYDDAQLDADLAQPGAAAGNALAQAASVLAPEAREWLMAEATRVGLADGPLRETQRDALSAVGNSLQLTAAQVHGVIALAEQGAQAN